LHDGDAMRAKVVTVTGMALGLVGLVGCDDARPLAEMVDKELHINSVANNFMISLLANGCPLLIPGTVHATLNGRAMTVEPGSHGSGFAGDVGCHEPTFKISALPDDLGPVLTFATEEVKVSASLDMAVERGTYHYIQNNAGGQVDDTGKYVTVWKKAKGEWKVAIDTATSDLPCQGGSGNAGSGAKPDSAAEAD